MKIGLLIIALLLGGISAVPNCAVSGTCGCCETPFGLCCNDYCDERGFPAGCPC
jgi:hypothetical protein